MRWITLLSKSRNSGHSNLHPRRCRTSIVRSFSTITLLSFTTVGGAHADKIDRYVTAQMAKQHIPALSLAVLKNGTPAKLKGYGLANVELEVRATPETVYQIGSMSKQFIAAGIVLLSDEGKLRLDDSVRKYFPDAPEPWSAITLRHLLAHTSGLQREAPGSVVEAKSDIETIVSSYSMPLAFAPGEKWQYSNLGYCVLAEIISRTAHMPWAEYLEQRIFKPLAMNAMRTTTAAELIPHRADGYHWTDSNVYRNAPVTQGVRPSGAFISTVSDLAKWDAALYSDKVLTEEQRRLMWTEVKLKDGSEKPYGFGWELGKFGRHTQVKHAGTMLGFRSQILRLPDDRLTIIVLTNATQAMPEKIAAGIASFYIPDLKGPQTQRKAAVLPAEILDGYSGRYQFPGRVITVERNHNELELSMPMAIPALGPEVAALLHGVSMNLATLTPENRNRFFDEDNSTSTYVFATDEDGTLQLSLENAEGKILQKGSKMTQEH
ncbi:MAG TPA: serine hydrolase domain-containing protein [Steroidobacteraceae bacterium]|nr:serine hydrolase domain-containing protein [Steroidobacteraceae bacterium]